MLNGVDAETLLQLEMNRLVRKIGQLENMDLFYACKRLKELETRLNRIGDLIEDHADELYSYHWHYEYLSRNILFRLARIQYKMDKLIVKYEKNETLLRSIEFSVFQQGSFPEDIVELIRCFTGHQIEVFSSPDTLYHLLTQFPQPVYIARKNEIELLRKDRYQTPMLSFARRNL